MIPKELNKITETDLQSLIDNSVTESKTLEYKEKLCIDSGDQRKEFLADVSSFANANGGDLIFGIDENREIGEPKSLCGIDIDNKDQLKLQLENIIRDGISPRLPKVEIGLILLSNSKHVLIIRIQKSWIAPHRVEFGKSHKFYSRQSSGKYPLDVGELKTAFILSETISEKIKRFREDRISKLLINEAPVVLSENTKLVLHIIPYNSFELAKQQYDINQIKEYTNDIRLLRGIGFNWRINFDGYFIQSGYSTKDKDVGSYIQLYKNGIIESVTSMISSLDGDELLMMPLEVEIIKALKTYLTYLKNINADLPIFIALTLINVKGLVIEVDPKIAFSYGGYPIDRDILITPEVVIDDYNVQVEQIMKPCFDSIWNTCGYENSFSYDNKGMWAR